MAARTCKSIKKGEVIKFLKPRNMGEYSTYIVVDAVFDLFQENEATVFQNDQFEAVRDFMQHKGFSESFVYRKKDGYIEMALI